ncbi:DUF393 domain-containing protein [Haloterrigena sp. H1]|uniref:DCC1-like thiol-disulfide oxidoreductase family protein n=1 Tax=Haloterrigena sp. H1 TaxID=2552943 RepID=UPI00110E0283|nr:DCC1-like thiol-disulfide oxidoreductase family protein [Haloterrigena sp. H1]TMT87530.1 DUF393 domain-containing protein [Haloterrigena sp. H1]
MTEEIFVYDDDCGFCTWWAEFFDGRSDLRIVGFHELTDELRERLPDDYEECAHLVTDDAVYSCGASIEEALVRADAVGPVDEVIAFLRHFEDYDQYRERAYRWAANNRDRLGTYLSTTPPTRQESTEG